MLQDAVTWFMYWSFKSNTINLLYKDSILFCSLLHGADGISQTMFCHLQKKSATEDYILDEIVNSSYLNTQWHYFYNT